MSVQISAYIEDNIKEKMEKYSMAYGIKQDLLIQNALDYYLNALHEIPTSMIIPSHIISVNKKTFETLVSSETKANYKLKKLLYCD